VNVRDAHEAASALQEIQARQAQVIGVVTVPVWYWWAIALPMIGLGVLVDTRLTKWIAIGAVVFALWVAAVSLVVSLRAYRRAQWRKETMGSRGPVLLVGFIGGVIGIGLGTAFVLQAVAVSHPATIGCALSGFGLVVGGPILMRAMQRVMLSNRVGITR
jgi:hypothetical protein